MVLGENLLKIKAGCNTWPGYAVHRRIATAWHHLCRNADAVRG